MDGLDETDNCRLASGPALKDVNESRSNLPTAYVAEPEAHSLASFRAGRMVTLAAFMPKELQIVHLRAGDCLLYWEKAER